MLFGGVEDLNTFASLGLSAYSALTDLYNLDLAPLMSPQLGTFLGVLWQSWWTYMLTIWPHEFGHWARARQVGGEFVFEKIALPWPKARMDLPEGVDLFSETLTSVGGFEINNLMRKIVLDDFYSRGYSYPNLMVHSFIQGIYFPVYAWLITPLVAGKIPNPEDPDTWINTKGDPVESAFLVYRNYYNKIVPLQNEPVDPALIGYYWRTVTFGLLWTLLDPSLYQGLAAFGRDMGPEAELITPLWIGNSILSWCYGTLFNISPLGYELHLINYLRIYGNYLRFSLWYGEPFSNLGVELSMPAIFSNSLSRFGATAGYWYQEPFGHGIYLGAESDLEILSSLVLRLRGGWKSEGYLLGLPMEEAWFLMGGIVIRRK